MPGNNFHEHALVTYSAQNAPRKVVDSVFYFDQKRVTMLFKNINELLSPVLFKFSSCCILHSLVAAEYANLPSDV